MPRSSVSGFTLVEMVVTVAILGVVGAAIAVFMKPAIDSYFDTNRRAIMTEGADVVARRIERELKNALPNSIVNPAGSCLLFIPTIGGGRYRVQRTAAGMGDILDFTIADGSFDVIAGDGLPPAPGAQVVIYNTGTEGADAYGGTNRATVADTSTAARIDLVSATQFPFASPGNRFHLVANRTDHYACLAGRLYRFAVAGIPSSRPTSCPAIPADAAVFADGVNTCAFTYNPGDGLVSLALGLSAEGETLMLQHDIHVDNSP